MHEGIEIGLKAFVEVGRRTRGTIHRAQLIPADCHAADARPDNLRSPRLVRQGRDAVLQAVDPTAEVISVSDYCKKYGTSDAYIQSRYWSIETRYPGSGVRMAVYVEIVRAILAALLGTVHQDVYSRIEEESRTSVLEAGERDPSVDWS